MSTILRMNWEKLLSTKRVNELDKCNSKYLPSQYIDPRSPFERDCDQLIFSYPFRRLQDKTQVIPFPEYDFVHTRLTHSLEVASVGRSFGKMAYSLLIKELSTDFLNQFPLTASDIGALVGASCLAHDIGNPPFGHSGEDSISYYFKQSYNFRPELNPEIFKRTNEDSITIPPRYEGAKEVTYQKKDIINQFKRWTDLSNFEGNANGFRIITRNCEKGINPTAALLGVFTKYPRESYLYEEPWSNIPPKSLSKYGFFQTEKDLFNLVAEELGLIRIPGINEVDIAFCRHPLSFLMEASDDIAYGIIDFEDGCRLGLIDFEKYYKKLKIRNKQGVLEEVEINNTPMDIFISIASLDTGFDKNRVENAADFKDAISYLRSKVINVLTHECFKIFELNYDDIMCGKYQNALIDDLKHPVITEGLAKMKKLVRCFVYNYPPVLQSEASGFEIMVSLIESLAISSQICISCKDEESEKAKKLKSLLPNEYSPQEEKEINKLTSEEIYQRVLLVLDYVSGMTDNYAMSLYRKINGISHR